MGLLFLWGCPGTLASRPMVPPLCPTCFFVMPDPIGHLSFSLCLRMAKRQNGEGPALIFGPSPFTPFTFPNCSVILPHSSHLPSPYTSFIFPNAKCPYSFGLLTYPFFFPLSSPVISSCLMISTFILQREPSDHFCPFNLPRFFLESSLVCSNRSRHIPSFMTAGLK